MSSHVKVQSYSPPDKRYKQVTDQCNSRHVQWAKYLGNKHVMEVTEHIEHRKKLVYSEQHGHYLVEIQLREYVEEATGPQVPQLPWFGADC